MSFKWILSSRFKKAIVSLFAIFGFLFVSFFSILFYTPFKEPSLLEKRFCAFCDQDILRRQCFYEDSNFYVLFTHKPIVKGHALIVPKSHAIYLQDMNAIEKERALEVIEKTHQILKEIYGFESYLILQKNGREAGQEVPHVHFHYIPRPTGDFATFPVLLKFMFRPFFPPISFNDMNELVSNVQYEIKEAAQ